ncbi:type III secretion system inner membrane ring lipoprotein SctJ [Granulosicoccus antarcticus]|uniref:Lipoprotein n=1 Tax=Granulosicoccus antarcticus IMCC3135 TaxID=1192854 RepID=A0A2Z2NGU7_9GAMM|nr:type III secretion inner membrane ring lipoprotein SctJ [Granulosicoccus antarcticus]ASJ70502.1 Yop proteins translocation lipoprotein J [Granulosicoccus antarcticus IMCC3135]
MMVRVNTWLRRLLAVSLIASLAACSEQSLYSGLSEQEANQMVATLSVAGLEASKQKLKGNEFSVSTSPDDFASAVQLLQDNGLPLQKFDTLGEVFAKEGFVSSPLEERARLNYALSQEIASTLSSMDGVILARVHLAVPPKNDLSDKATPSSASVFVKHRAGVDLSGNVSQIKALVVNGIENLPYENVTVVLFESSGTYVPPVVSASASSMPLANPQQMSLLPIYLTSSSAGIVALLAMLLVIALVGIRIWRSRQA